MALRSEPHPEQAREKPRLSRALRLRCPLCGKAPIFRDWFRVHPRCAGCGWAFDREPGYFLGSIYINYGLSTVMLCLLWVLLNSGSCSSYAFNHCSLANRRSPAQLSLRHLTLSGLDRS